ncbi:hypothetical protein RR45_GL000019 [Lactococcus chungangensis CAU 28 = DSM 22330]|nr:hypothetical protein RR45_GL000019 [Lactococcus chungangensis CAU 28 = DSM 22330]
METKYKTQEEQIEFLKKHESQMTEYVKSFNKTIQTVEFDWNATDTGVVGNGTPQGGGVVIRVSGYVNDDPKLGFYIAVNSTLESTSSFEPEQDIYFLSNGVAYLRQGE